MVLLYRVSFLSVPLNSFQAVTAEVTDVAIAAHDATP
jgi:hypothetical protein